MNLHFGFSYIGLIFLFMLFIPNLIWIKHKPKDYEKYEKNENKILLCFEKVGQILVISISLIFTDFNIKPITPWSSFLGIASFIMLLYEGYWIRYFKSDKTMKDFYTSFLGIPLAGATLPIFAYLMLGIYGKNVFLILAAVILGIGHIGIHYLHKKEIKES